MTTTPRTKTTAASFQFEPSGELGLYSKEFDLAGRVLIMARVNDGQDYITLEYLYTTLGATTDAQRNSALWAVQRAKDAEIIVRTDLKGVYKVVRA